MLRCLSVGVVSLLSKNSLTINFLNKQEIKHERIVQKEEVQEVFKKEDVIELIQNHE